LKRPRDAKGARQKGAGLALLSLSFSSLFCFLSPPSLFRCLCEKRRERQQKLALFLPLALPTGRTNEHQQLLEHLPTHFPPSPELEENPPQSAFLRPDAAALLCLPPLYSLVEAVRESDLFFCPSPPAGWNNNPSIDFQGKAPAGVRRPVRSLPDTPEVFSCPNSIFFFFLSFSLHPCFVFTADSLLSFSVGTSFQSCECSKKPEAVFSKGMIHLNTVQER